MAGGLRVRPTTAREAVRLALNWVGYGKYHLGAASNIFGSTPLDGEGACDCSSFVGWAIGIDRSQKWGDYDTWRAIDDVWHLDNTGRAISPGPRLLYDPVMPGDSPRPGDLVVKPGTDMYIGHIGVITAVDAGYMDSGENWYKHLQVAHCTAGSRYPYAIQKTDASPWLGHMAYIIRPKYAAGSGALGALLIGAAAAGGAIWWFRRRGGR
jgi:hypothetical protein